MERPKYSVEELEDAVKNFCNTQADPDLHKQALNLVVLHIHKNKNGLTFSSLISQRMQEVLTDINPYVRGRATLLLVEIFSRLPDLELSDEAIFSLFEFFMERLESDYESASSCIIALQFLFEHHSKSLSRTIKSYSMSLSSSIEKLLKAHHVPAMPQTYRNKVYTMFRFVLSNDDFSGILEKSSALAFQYLDSLQGEKDPRCLLVGLSNIRLLQSEFDQEIVESITSYIFDVVFVYFPITFKPPPNDKFNITTEMMVNSLNSIFIQNKHFAGLIIPSLLEKLTLQSSESGVSYTKQASFELLSALIINYPLDVTSRYFENFKDVISKHVVSPEDLVLVDYGLLLASNIGSKLASGLEMLRGNDFNSLFDKQHSIVLPEEYSSFQSLWNTYVNSVFSTFKEEAYNKFESLSTRGNFQVLLALASENKYISFQIWKHISTVIITNLRVTLGNENDSWRLVVASDFLMLLLKTLSASPIHSKSLQIIFNEVETILFSLLENSKYTKENGNLFEAQGNCILSIYYLFKSFPLETLNKSNFIDKMIDTIARLLVQSGKQGQLRQSKSLVKKIFTFLNLLFIEENLTTNKGLYVIEMCKDSFFPVLTENIEYKLCLDILVEYSVETKAIDTLLTRLLHDSNIFSSNAINFDYLYAFETLVLKSIKKDIDIKKACIAINFRGKLISLLTSTTFSLEDIETDAFIDICLRITVALSTFLQDEETTDLYKKCISLIQNKPINRKGNHNDELLQSMLAIYFGYTNHEDKYATKIFSYFMDLLQESNASSFSSKFTSLLVANLLNKETDTKLRAIFFSHSRPSNDVNEQTTDGLQSLANGKKLALIPLLSVVAKGLAMKGDMTALHLLLNSLNWEFANDNQQNDKVMLALAGAFSNLNIDETIILVKAAKCSAAFLYKQRVKQFVLKAFLAVEMISLRPSQMLSITSFFSTGNGEISNSFFPNLVQVIIKAFALTNCSRKIVDIMKILPVELDANSPLVLLQLSTLRSLFVLVQDNSRRKDLIVTLSEHLNILMPSLLVISCSVLQEEDRLKALDILLFLGKNVTYHELYPLKKHIAKAMNISLDDDRKEVRKKAVSCRNLYLTLTTKLS